MGAKIADEAGRGASLPREEWAMIERSRMGMAALALATLNVGACGEAGIEATAEVTTTQAGLYLMGAKWPSNAYDVTVIPVCFTAASVARPDFAAVRDNMRYWINTSWSAAADITFTGWDQCPTVSEGANGKVQVNLLDVPPGWASTGYQGAASPTFVNIAASSEQGAVIHFFGHVLGFAREMARPNFTDATGTSPCQEADTISGQTLGTPANDHQSIMARGFCNNRNDLSQWDVIGVQTGYGRRRTGTVVGMNNRCLDISGQIADGTQSVLADCVGGPWQNWTHNSSDDALSITSQTHVRKCLDLPGASDANGTIPQLYGCHGQTNQQWALKYVHILGLARKCLERSGG